MMNASEPTLVDGILSAVDSPNRKEERGDVVLMKEHHQQRLRRKSKREGSSSSSAIDQEVVPVDQVALLCGLTAGVAQAGLFNPIDRALYLSVKNRTRFLSPSNFRSPYQGFLQSIGAKALSGGIYFPLEHFFMSKLPRDSGPSANFLAGTAAGLTNAMILNPISAVKYKTWGRDVNRGMIEEIVNMWTKGGARPFFNGLTPTLLRDVSFGGVYTFLRLEIQWLGLPHEYQWAGNMIAAATATIVSGPFNLARNIQYSTKSKKTAKTIMQVMEQLIMETKAKPTTHEKWLHVQNRLRLGWGTARVAVGMAFGHFVYDECMNTYQVHKSDIQRVEERLHLIPPRRRTLSRKHELSPVSPPSHDDELSELMNKTSL